MYEGYINSEKKIKAIAQGTSEEDLASLNGDIMMATSTSGYKLMTDLKNKDGSDIPPMWYHVTLVDQFVDQDVNGQKVPVKVKTWQPIKDEKGIPAEGAWSKMKARTKQYRTKN